MSITRPGNGGQEKIPPKPDGLGEPLAANDTFKALMAHEVPGLSSPNLPVFLKALSHLSRRVMPLCPPSDTMAICEKVFERYKGTLDHKEKPLCIHFLVRWGKETAGVWGEVRSVMSSDSTNPDILLSALGGFGQLCQDNVALEDTDVDSIKRLAGSPDEALAFSALKVVRTAVNAHSVNKTKFSRDEGFIGTIPALARSGNKDIHAAASEILLRIGRL
jgi:hypothetical protein